MDFVDDQFSIAKEKTDSNENTIVTEQAARLDRPSEREMIVTEILYAHFSSSSFFRKEREEKKNLSLWNPRLLRSPSDFSRERSHSHTRGYRQ